MFHRRHFLTRSALLGFGASIPNFLCKSALASPLADERGAKETILVVLQLTGGNDGLNTVIPRKDPEYAKLRPNLAIAKAEQRTVTDEYALHPAMGAAGKLFDEGLLTIVHGVGYPNPSQSHFRSMDIWNAGHLHEAATDGWLGRAQLVSKASCFHIGNEEAPLALLGAPAKAPSVGSLDEFQRKFLSTSITDARQQESIVRSSSTPNVQPNPLLDFVQRTATTTYEASDRLKLLNKNYNGKVPYPTTTLGNKFKLIAQLIDANVGARIYYLSQDGYDTHSGQGGKVGAHANLLENFSEALAAFIRDVNDRGHGKRVAVLAFSEFGRRAKENGSQGTDHGSAAPVFLAGARLKGGFLGQHPSLTKLEEGNLVHTVDFRQVYAGLLSDWLGVPAAEVLGTGHEPIALLR